MTGNNFKIILTNILGELVSCSHYKIKAPCFSKQLNLHNYSVQGDIHLWTLRSPTVKAKSFTEVKQAQKTLFKAIVIEERGHNSVWAWLRSDKEGESFQELESLIMGFYVFANWPSPKRKWTFLIFKTEGSCTTWIKVFAKVRPLPTHRDWETGTLSFLITLKGIAPRCLKKISPVVILAEDFKKMRTPEVQINNIQWQVFLK